MDFNLMVPNSYHHTVYDIDYPKLYENGIKYAVFDIDCTILPFDDVNLTEDNILLFEGIKSLGIDCAFCSSGFKNRVEPVGNGLDVKYIYGAKKPFVGLGDIKDLFDDDFNIDNSVFIGDSLYFDMYNAGRLNMNKILVDMIVDGFNFKVFPNEFIQAALFRTLRKYGLENKKYYKGSIER